MTKNIERIETERLVIRPWAAGDVSRLLEIRSIDEVAKWLSNPDSWSDESTSHDAIERWSGLIANDGVLGHWAVVPRGGVPVGAVSLQRTPDDTETTIGWYLHPDESGQGFAREAAQALLDRCFLVDESLRRVWAVMWPENTASATVAGRIGMRDLGVIQDPWYGEPDSPFSRMFLQDRHVV